MKWLNKLKTENLEESKLGKRVAAKIDEYNELKKEIEELEDEEDEIKPEDLAEYKDDLKVLKSELLKLDDNICESIDKYLKNSAAASERFKKMHENKKAQKQAPATTGSQSVPQPTQVAAQGTIVEEVEAVEEEPKKEEKKGMGFWGWLGVGVLTVAGVALGVNLVKNRQ